LAAKVGQKKSRAKVRGFKILQQNYGTPLMGNLKSV
jgi:hypothetical protein